MSVPEAQDAPWSGLKPALALLIAAFVVNLFVLDGTRTARSGLRDIVSTAVSPDGRWVVHADSHGKLELHDIDAGTRKIYDAPGGSAHSLTILPRGDGDETQGDTLLYTGRDGALRHVSIWRGSAKGQFTPLLVAIGGVVVRQPESQSFGARVIAGDSDVALLAHPGPTGSIPSVLSNDPLDGPSIQPYGNRITSALTVMEDRPSSFASPLARGTYRSAGGYGSRRDPATRRETFHPGTDFASDLGTPVLASARGRVTLAERHRTYGLRIEIDHGDGWLTRYAHLQSFRVKANDTVQQGQVIGTVGSTGISTAPHLHFEVLHNDVARHPLDALKPRLSQTGWIAGTADGTLALFTRTPQGPRLVAETKTNGAGIRQIVPLPSSDVSQPAAWSINETGVVTASFSPDGQMLLIGMLDGTLNAWERRAKRTIARHDAEVVSATFDPSGTHVVAAYDDGTATVWNVILSMQTVRLVGHEAALTGAVIGPGATTIATTSRDNTARLWEMRSGRVNAVLRHDDAVLDAAFSPDGTLIATASEDGSVRLWHVATGTLRATLSNQQSTSRLSAGTPRRTAVQEAVTARRVRFKPDGSRIAAAFSDGNVRLWDTETGRLVARMQHGEAVRSLAFSPDGLRLVTASWDRTARLWDATTGAATGTPMVHNGWVQDAVFSSDATKIVTASVDTATRLWDGKTGAPLGSYGESPADIAKFNSAGTQVVRVTKNNVEVVPVALFDSAGDEAPVAARKPTRFAALDDRGQLYAGVVSGGTITEEALLIGAPRIRERGADFGLSIDGKPIIDGRTVDGRTPAGTVFKDCASCPEMIVVPPGRLQRARASATGKGPQIQTVRFSGAFAVGRFEVTNAEFRLGAFTEGGARRPAGSVSWNQATAYARELADLTGQSYRLLSEDEWEYTAAGVAFRAPGSYAPTLGGSANIGAVVCCTGQAAGADRWVDAAPVGQFSPNGFGLFDMVGNAAEWVRDCWTIDLRDGPDNGSAYDLPQCGRRVLRGGGFLGGYAAVDARQFATDGMAEPDTGLRVARELK